MGKCSLGQITASKENKRELLLSLHSLWRCMSSFHQFWFLSYSLITRVNLFYFFLSIVLSDYIRSSSSPASVDLVVSLCRIKHERSTWLLVAYYISLSVRRVYYPCSHRTHCLPWWCASEWTCFSLLCIFPPKAHPLTLFHTLFRRRPCSSAKTEKPPMARGGFAFAPPLPPRYFIFTLCRYFFYFLFSAALNLSSWIYG